MKTHLIILILSFAPFCAKSQKTVKYFKDYTFNEKGIISGKDSIGKEEAINTMCYRFTYNKNYKPVKVEYFVKNKLSEDEDGIAFRCYKYNHKDELTETSQHGADGKLKNSKTRGDAKFRFKYNKKGVLIKRKLYGTDGKLKKIMPENSYE